MAYTVLKGKVNVNDVTPPEEQEEPDNNVVEVPLREACEHGFYVHSACFICNPISKKPTSYPVPLESPLYERVYAWSPLKIGDKVCRRIRMNEVGIVTSITYVFTQSKSMREIWIDFCNSGRSTPYTPDELLQLKVQ